MKRQYLRMMFHGVSYLHRIPENKIVDVVAVDHISSLKVTLFHPKDSGKD